MAKFYVNNLSLHNNEIPSINKIDCRELGDPPWESKTKCLTIIQYFKSKLCHQVLASVLACYVNLASGASLGYITPALPSLTSSSSRLQITDSEGSWIAGIIMLGALIGGILAGPCISLGRRRALWFASVPLSSAWLLIALAPNVWYIYASHLILGMCLGIISDASQLYVSEAASPERRGALGCIPVLMFNVGILLCYAAGAYLEWEKLALFGGAVTLPSLFLPAIFPESPSYLVAKGRLDEAVSALHWLRGANCDVNAEFQELLHCEKGPGLIERLRSMFSREILIPMLLIAIVRILSRFCGLRAILCYTQTIFMSSHSVLDADIATVITGVVQLIATLFACGLLDRVGRRKLLIGSQGVMGVSLVGLGCYLCFEGDVDGEKGSILGWIPLITILIYIIGNSIGLGPVSGILIGEIIPQRHRSIASSLTGSLSWLSAFIVTKTFLDLRTNLHLYGALWVYASICIVGIPFVYFCLPETRGISPLQIEVLFKRSDIAGVKKPPGKSSDKTPVILDVESQKSTSCDENLSKL